MRTTFACYINSRLKRLAERPRRMDDKEEAGVIELFVRAAFLLQIITEDELNVCFVNIRHALYKEYVSWHLDTQLSIPANIKAISRAKYTECIEAVTSGMQSLQNIHNVTSVYTNIRAEQCDEWLKMAAIISSLSKLTEMWTQFEYDAAMQEIDVLMQKLRCINIARQKHQKPRL